MIVITTPTGQIGSQVLARVLDSGESVRVIARDPSRLAPTTRERVEVVQGSSDDPDVVSEAFDGADSVFWVVPPQPHAEDVVTYYLDFTGPACQAITSRRVGRVVGVSSLGREASNNVGLVSAAYAMDGLIERTGVHYRALRMPAFMDDIIWQAESIRTEGTFSGVQSGNRRMPSCATRDIAAVGAALLLDDSWTGQGSAPVLGPADLSFDDMAQIMSDVLGRPIRYQQETAEAFKAKLMQRMGEPYAQGVIDNQAEADRGIYNAEPRTPQSTTPTSFRQWCTDVLTPAVA